MSTIVDRVLYTMPGWAARVNNNVIEVYPATQIKKTLNELRSTKPYIVILRFGYKIIEVIGKCEQKYLSPPNSKDISTIPYSKCLTNLPNNKQIFPVGVMSEQLIRILELEHSREIER